MVKFSVYLNWCVFIIVKLQQIAFYIFVTSEKFRLCISYELLADNSHEMLKFIFSDKYNNNKTKKKSNVICSVVTSTLRIKNALFCCSSSEYFCLFLDAVQVV